MITGAGAGPDHAGADVIRPGLMSLETREGEPAGPVGSELPAVFGRYLLIQRLSRGGMGEIFLAKHGLAGFEKLAVIKKVLGHLSANQQFISRFIDEAQVAIKLSHANITQVFEVGRIGDEYFLAMEYVEGRDLRRILGKLERLGRRMPPELALLIGRELANGLAYAHRRTAADGGALNLVHCDISPPNVLVSFEGETKVIDFGIARSELRTTDSDPKMGFGKFGYMAPEQLIRGATIDHRTDIYAAGVVIFECLTGTRLYEPGPSPDYRTLARAVAQGEHKRPSEIDPALAAYDELIVRALRPRRDDRYPLASDLRDALQAALVQCAPTLSTDQLGSFVRELFADETGADRELADRVARAHLADYQEALSTQAIETVSFALAGASAATTGTAPPPAPVVVAAPVALPAPAAPAQVASGTQPLSGTDLVEVSELGALAPAADLHRPSTARRSVVLPVVLLVVVGVLVAVLVWPRSGVAPVSGPADAAVLADARPTAAPVDAAPADAAPVVAQADASRADRPDRPRPRPDASTSTAPAGDAVLEQFRAVSREYRAFKAKYGDRLEDAWNELATFAQFSKQDRAGLARKIDSFRAKMRAVE